MNNEQKKPAYMIFFDTETTGLNAGVDKVIEFAAIAYNKERQIVNKIQIYIDPLKEIPYEAYQVHKMNRDFLLKHGAKPFNESFPMIENFFKECGATQFLAHNASFDIKMMCAEIDEMNGKPWNLKGVKNEEPTETFLDIVKKYSSASVSEFIDTIVVAKNIEELLSDDDPVYVKEFLPKTKRKSFTMDSISQRIGIDLSKRSQGHEALIDCEILADMYFKLLEIDATHGAKYSTLQEYKRKSLIESDLKPIRKSMFNQKNSLKW